MLMETLSIVRQTFDFATPVSSHNSPHNVLALNPDYGEQFVQARELVLRPTPKNFRTETTSSRNKPENFTANEDENFSKPT